MAKEIPLTKGKVAIVDDDRYAELSEYSWHATAKGYAVRKDGDNYIFMHRAITDAPDDKQVDHINHNKTDNRLINLRLCTNAENHRNRGLQSNNTSGYKGVSFRKDTGKWEAYLKCDRKMYRLGCFEDKNDAARMYNFWAKDMFGEFAYLNKIKEVV